MNKPPCSTGHGAAHDRSRDGPSGSPSGSPFGGFGPRLGLEVIFRQAVAFSDILPVLIFPRCFQMLVGIENRAALGRTPHEKQKKKHTRQ